MGMYACAVFAAAQWAYSFALPYVIRYTNVPIAYAGSQFLATACFIVFVWITKAGQAVTVMIFIAVNFVRPT